MARRSKSAVSDYPVDVVENIVDIDVSAEMETSFLEYSYSVIYSRSRWACAPTRATSRAPA